VTVLTAWATFIPKNETKVDNQAATVWFAKTLCGTFSGPCNIVTSRSDVKPGPSLLTLRMLLIGKDRRLDDILANDNHKAYSGVGAEWNHFTHIRGKSPDFVKCPGNRAEKTLNTGPVSTVKWARTK
jgi:hypothetical protein